jgi:hypothetical protein
LSTRGGAGKQSVPKADSYQLIAVSFSLSKTDHVFEAGRLLRAAITRNGGETLGLDW